MSEEIPQDVKELLELYTNSRLVKYGAPDEYQYHQNRLTRELARFVLKDYLLPDDGESDHNKPIC